MMNVATQARRKNHDSTCPPVRCKHFISCSYLDLEYLATHLDGITTERYTEELVKKTTDKGDCCMLTVVERGHSLLEYSVSKTSDQPLSASPELPTFASTYDSPPSCISWTVSFLLFLVDLESNALSTSPTLDLWVQMLL